ncbi:MAG: hypothetical protein ACK4NC_05320 [Candidatus Gracilibacteria bacterium]
MANINRRREDNIIQFRPRALKPEPLHIEVGNSIDTKTIMHLESCIREEIQIIVQDTPTVLFHHQKLPDSKEIIRFIGTDTKGMEVAFDVNRFNGRILDVIYR